MSEDALDVEEPSRDTLPEDVKDVLKLSLKWIQELPPSRLKEFKNSPDFAKYKDVLVKYNVAKKVDGK
jgi:hypothetical protein